MHQGDKISLLHLLILNIFLNVFYHAGEVINHLPKKENDRINFIFNIVDEIMMLEAFCNIK